jgi:FkbM family methyltransferase
MAFNLKAKIIKVIPVELRKFLKRKLMLSTNKENIKIYESLNGFPRYTKTTTQLVGHKIIIPDSTSFLFMHKEIFEENIYKFKTSNPAPYIIDGGANIGLSTIYFKLLFPSSKIIAFEPDPEIYSILKENIKSFNFTDVELIKKGLWNKNIKLPFRSEGADAGIIADVDKTVSASKTIEVVSLKTYLQETVDFLKLDIEGSETIVLMDIQNDLDKVERIFVEYHSFIGQSQTLNEIIDILTKADFRLHVSSPGLSSKAPFINLNIYNNMDMQLNIYGFKEI